MNWTVALKMEVYQGPQGLWCWRRYKVREKVLATNGRDVGYGTKLEAIKACANDMVEVVKEASRITSTYINDNELERLRNHLRKCVMEVSE